MTARLALTAFACLASSSIFALPVTATTSKASRPPSCSITSSVLLPIEPVEPRIVTRRFFASLGAMIVFRDLFIVLMRLYSRLPRATRC